MHTVTPGLPSLVAGSTAQPLLHLTVDALLAQQAAAHGRREAFVFRDAGVRYTYAEFDREVDAVARGLIALGLAPGDRIGIWAPNRPEWVVTMFAAARAGLILVNVNPAYRTSELEFALRHVGCRALVYAPAFKSSDYCAMLQELIPSLASEAPGALSCAAFPDLRLLVQLGGGAMPGALPWEQLARVGEDLAPALLAERRAALNADQPYNIQFTSGTTGLPKGATLTHFNIVNNGWFTAEGMRLAGDDRLCVPVPLYHCFGMVMGVLGAMTHGATTVFPGEAFDPLATLETVAAERCTALYGVPTMFIAELEHPRFREFDVSSLRTGIMAGAPCPIAVMKRVLDELHMPEVTIAYGMTETSPVSFQSACDDPLEMRVSTVGRIHPHVQVKVVDSSGAIVPRGTSGELCTRGYSVMLGYWNEPERTRDAIDAEGWMHTGDLATLDSDGYCNIVGRVKDMIIRGGENVSPREVEEFLYRHPAVQDVAVVGVPDHRYGEEICACIRLREGATASAEDIREFCRGKIAHYKVPRYVQFVDAFPLTVTGKVQKFAIRARMRDVLGLAEEAHA